VAAHLDHAVVISADDFYLDADDPRLPNHDGRPDWEAQTALDLDALQSSLTELLKGRPVTIPCYDMSSSSAVGKKLIDPEGACAVVVEGVHVFDLQLGVPANISRVLIVSSRWKILLRRLKRDISEARYSHYAAFRNVVPLFLHYRNYNQRESEKADYVIHYSGQPTIVAERIKEATNYWTKT
jgi:uridine kinase